MYFGLILGNTIFLLVRGCTKHTLRLDSLLIDNKKILKIDTILALLKLVDQFNNEFVPAFVTVILYFNPTTSDIKLHGIAQA
jgi:hypothetical protein